MYICTDTYITEPNLSRCISKFCYTFLAGLYLFKVSNGKIRAMYSPVPNNRRVAVGS